MASLEELLSTYPSAPAVSSEAIRAAMAAGPRRVFVVLDDDPTGTQSVADLPVLTRWETADLAWALARDVPAVYVLTNTRSLAPAEAAGRNREVARAALEAASGLGIAVSFVSRGDSTLRGHFPLETDVLREEYTASTGRTVDGILLVPAFPDAGRVTIGGVHYFVLDGQAVPVAETEFARDATFGYRHSDLPGYVEEKTGGTVAATDVLVLDLDTIRRGGPEAIADLLLGARDAVPIAVDYVAEEDLRQVALGLALAEARGGTYLFRAGPPFARGVIGQDPRPPLTAAEIFAGGEPATRGGLIVVGSHVGVTTRQLDHLGANLPVALTAEIDVASVIDPARREAHLEGLVRDITTALSRGNVVVHTSRELVKTEDGDESLDISRRVSAAVVDVVRRTLANTPPRFVIAKGGITSSDVAAHGLEIRHAIVRGPMLPGIVSLWEPQDGPARGIPYIVFAGNVGADSSLTDVTVKLSATDSKESHS
ncbi:MAG: four-carbon acid sugar kinase family protein [Arthrobacter sp.]|uniref:four-carbon acid sugar kinase family protein n=1 Tax=Arthrobacter sp. TaxID=1667 RepID=UPI00348DA0D8